MNSRPRVLVIDDDPLFRSLITSMLRRDYLVTVAGEGSEGYQKALEYPPQLAVIDVQMPGMDGLQTVQAFRAHPALAKVPVMMLTSDASRQTVMASIEAGANDYVIKTTLNREELLKKAHRLMGLQLAKLENDGLDTVGSGPMIVPSPSTENSGNAMPPAGSPDAAEAEAASLQAIVDNWE